MPRYLDIISPPIVAPQRRKPTLQATGPIEKTIMRASNSVKKSSWHSFRLLLASGVILAEVIFAVSLNLGSPSAPVKIVPIANAALAQTSQVPDNGVAVVPAVSTPWRLQIPVIKVDATVEAVGQTASGNMDVPSNFTNVGWFKLGTRIGTRGTAVLAGHFNDRQNKPAVFWDLRKLKVGDYVYVADSTKPRQRFRVTEKQSYSIASAPLSKIFGATDGVRLNLITCSGKWNQAAKDYSQRLVVYTELVP